MSAFVKWTWLEFYDLLGTSTFATHYIYVIDRRTK